MDIQQFCLRWDDFQRSVTAAFDRLRRDGELTDVTICCEGRRVGAHRLVLSACSPYFRDLLKETQGQHMAIFLKDTAAADLQAIVEFMYKGSVNVAQSQLASFIKTAEMLQIRGLSGDEEKAPGSPGPEQKSVRHSSPQPASKRRRTSGPEPAGGSSGLSPTPGSARWEPEPAGGSGRRNSPPNSSSAVLHLARDAAAAEMAREDGAISAPANSAQLRTAVSPALGMAPVKIESGEAELVSEQSAGLEAAFAGYGTDDESAIYGERQLAGLHAPSVPGDTSHLSPAGGTAQRAAGVSGEEGATPGGGGRNVCDICGSSYKHRESLYHHRKKHQGLTTCPICAKVCSIVADLRRHMEVSHNLSGEQVRRIIPTKPKDRITWGELISRAGGNGQGRCTSVAREVQSPGPEPKATATDVTEAQNLDIQ